MNEPYRILALDGGGLRGVFTTAVLVEAEDAYGPPFVDSFDLLVGTSTGGIIALGLASGRTCSEMLDFYQRVGPDVFRNPRALRRLFRPKYSRDLLDRYLREYFGHATRMNDLLKPVCITSYELVAGTTRVWKDDHSPELRWGGDQLVWKVAASTSAAPTYLAPVQLGAVDSHVDGGVWGNNPALVGIAEAIKYARQDLRDVRVLSIGTTSAPLRVSSHERAKRMGLGQWMNKGLGLIQDSSSMAATNVARFMLGDDRYLRLDSESARRVPLDDAVQCRPLQEWGHDVGQKNIDAIGGLLGLERRVRRSERP